MLLIAALPGVAAGAGQDPQAPAPRQKIGVAFGGGSARGLAHVGIVRWLEEHHIPIDVIAGTSMGGLIGGAVASGLSSTEISDTLADVDWDEMFGFSPFRYKNIRRKNDARAYPSRIELGVKNGLSLPIALNSGQQVDFLLARIAGPYGALASFDDLPTPFRALAVDLVSAQPVVLDRGSLATALRATMSLPGIFPPIEREGAVLVDGGAMNNVPADVVRAMGADVVIAISVSTASGDTRTVSRSMLGLMGQTVDVMMAATTRAALQSATIVITPPLEGFGSLDWRRGSELADAGYAAAEAMRDRLLPYAVSESEWAAYLEARRARRKVAWPAPRFVSVVGTAPADQARIETALAPLLSGQTLDVAALETTLEAFAGLDRYETVAWQLDDRGGEPGLRIDARPKAHAPPFLMLGVNLENTTSNDFAFQLAARYLTFDVAGLGSELRVDGAIGAQPNLGAELYRPFGGTLLFVGGTAGTRRRTFSFVREDVVVARYNEDSVGAGVFGGVNLGRDSDIRANWAVSRISAGVDTGNPGLPQLDGNETRAQLAWRYDGQDSPVIPSSGTRAVATIDHVIAAPEPTVASPDGRSSDGITQIDVHGSAFWSRRRRDRLFLSGGVGTTWGRPLATDQFQLGAPLRLGAYAAGELRGDHYAVVTAGYLRAIGRLPDFLGGWIHLGAWTENGSAFDDLDTAQFRSNASAAAVADTLLGPVIVGASFGFDGARRYYIGVGRLF